jgi:predicted GTPase
MADVVIINKMDTATLENIETVRRNITEVNPRATVIECNSPLTVADPEAIRGKRVLAIEDGPTVTHGEMPFGAAALAARKFGAATLVDPRPYAAGSIRGTFAKYPHCREVLPAMGYGARQIAELEATIRSTPCDLVLIGTPIDLGRMLKIDKPAQPVTYELEERSSGQLRKAITMALD